MPIHHQPKKYSRAQWPILQYSFTELNKELFTSQLFPSKQLNSISLLQRQTSCNYFVNRYYKFYLFKVLKMHFIHTSVQSATQSTIGLTHHYSLSHYIKETQWKGGTEYYLTKILMRKILADSGIQTHNLSDWVIMSTALGPLASKASSGGPLTGSHQHEIGVPPTHPEHDHPAE